MRDIIIPAVIVLVGIGGIALWLLNVGSVRPSQPPSEMVQSTDAPTANSSPPKKSKPVSGGAKAPSLVTEEVAIAVPTTPPPSPKPIVRAKPAEKPQLPAANQIVIGGEKTWVTTNLGEPTLTATTSDGGHLRETLVYARDQGRVTIVLIDGKISSAF